MKRFVIAISIICIIVCLSVTYCVDKLAVPIAQEEIVVEQKPTQADIRYRIVQTFACYIDRNLLPSYKKGAERKQYVYEIANAAADIEDMVPTLGCWTLAIAKKESDFRIRGNLKSTAKGLCQVIPKYHKKTLQAFDITEEDLIKSPEKSLIAGFAVFMEYFKRNPREPRKALLKYRGLGTKGLSRKRCENYAQEVEKEFDRLKTSIYEKD